MSPLSLETHHTPSIHAFLSDGSIEYKQKETPSSKLSKQIASTWASAPFRTLTVQKLEQQRKVEELERGKTDIDEEDDRKMEVEPKEGIEVKQLEVNADKKGEMSFKEMELLRGEMKARLDDAWLEIHTIQELATSLLPPSSTLLNPPPNPSNPFPYIHLSQPGSIPLHSLSTTTTSSFSGYTIREVQDLRNAVGRGRRAVVEGKEQVDEERKWMKGKGREGRESFWEVVSGLSGLSNDNDDDDEEEEEEEEEQMEETTGLEGKGEGKGKGKGKESWTLLPRWLSDGTPENKQLAKDVMIPYAADEAAPHIRRRGIAFINSQTKASPTEDDNRPTPLLFPNRRYRRLRLSFHTTSGISYSPYPTTTSMTSTPSSRAEQAKEELALAQAEIFDEEIFECLVRECRGTGTSGSGSGAGMMNAGIGPRNDWNGRVTLDRVEVRPVSGVELRVEMLNQVENDSEQDTLDDSDHRTVSPAKATLLLAMLRLRMLQIYKIRKPDNPSPQPPQNIAPSLSRLSSINRPPPPRSSSQSQSGLIKPTQQHLVLPPIIAYIRYQAFINQIHEILQKYVKSLASLGLNLEVEREDGRETGGMDWVSLMDGEGGDDAAGLGRGADAPSGSIEVVLDRRQIVSILASTTCQLTLIFPHTTLISQDIAQLPTYLTPEIQKCLVRILRDAMTEKTIDDGEGDGDEAKVIVDEGRGTVTSKDVKILVQADSESNAFIIKAYKIVRNKEKSSENMVEVAEYISGSEQDLLSWVKSLA